MIKNINSEEIKKLLKNKDENSVFIDVRTEEEFKEENIDGFVNIPLDKIINNDYKLEKDKTIYLLCRSGGRSLMAGKIMEKNNFKNIYNIDGGIINLKK